MTNDPKGPPATRTTAGSRTPGQYGEVVGRLQEIVEALEKGDLSLEQSLDRFSEGITLVKQGEKLLAEAEKKVEQLLSEDGRTAPLKVPEEGAGVATAQPPRPVKRPSGPPPDEGDDVPF